jgi:hypothetical protein
MNIIRHKKMPLILLGLIILSAMTLACSVLQGGGLFVDTKATNEAIQKTQDAQDARATEQALQRTQDALDQQATQQASQATQAALDAQATLSSMATQNALQQQQAQQTQEAQQSQQQSQTLQYPIPPQFQSTNGSNLYIVNNSSQTICYFYASYTTDTNWGADWLGTSNTIPPGTTFTFTGVGAGSYDFKADDCSNNEIASDHGIDFPTYDTWTLSDTSSGNTGGTYNFYIVNNSSQTVCYLYISPDTSPDWGEDWLGSATIPAGTSYTFYSVAANVYDIKAEDCSHNQIVTYDKFDFPTYDTFTISNTN